MPGNEAAGCVARTCRAAHDGAGTTQLPHTYNAPITYTHSRTKRTRTSISDQWPTHTRIVGQAPHHYRISGNTVLHKIGQAPHHCRISILHRFTHTAGQRTPRTSIKADCLHTLPETDQRPATGQSKSNLLGKARPIIHCAQRHDREREASATFWQSKTHHLHTMLDKINPKKPSGKSLGIVCQTDSKLEHCSPQCNLAPLQALM